MVYKFRPGYSSKISAQDAGDRLEEIKDVHDGLIRPRDVVKDAVPKTAILHPVFEWDNKVAANLHREDQARSLIRSIEVVREPENEMDEPKREIAFVSIATPFHSNQGYVSTEDAMSDPVRRDIVLETALSQFRSLRRRYGNLVELASLWAVIDDLEEAHA